MKEITRISLAALPYNISVDAKKQLETYLQAVQKNLHAEPDAMKEIEARIAELLTVRGITGEKVIDTADIEKVKQQLGKPTDFLDEAADDSVTTEKRIMRDNSRAILGGVCSGLAAYFAVDAAWLRLAMAIATIMTGGSAALLYLVAWVVIPPARTATERLQMAGKPVTLTSLQQASAADDEPSRYAKLLLKVLRIFGGIVLAIGGAAVCALLAVTTWHVVANYGSRMNIHDWVYAGLFGTAGGFFVLLCWLLAYMLLGSHISRRLLITTTALIVLGIGSFSTGSGLVMLSRYNQPQNATTLTAAIPVDSLVMANTKSLVIDARFTIVTYHVSTGTPRISLEYAPEDSFLKTAVQFNQGTLSLPGDQTGCTASLFEGCSQTRPQLHVYGPALEHLNVASGDVTYDTPASQTQLAAEVRSSGILTLNGAVDSLILGVGDNSELFANNAAAKHVTLRADGTSYSEFGNVEELTITVPTACPAGSVASITAVSATKASLNGTELKNHASLPCVNYKITGARD